MVRGCLAFFTLLLAAAGVRADPFAIDLTAKAGKASRTAHAETTGSEGLARARPALDASAGQAVTVTWTLRCTDPAKTYKDVIVHFVAVKEDKVGQRVVPKLDKDVAAETALSMDFKPKDSADGEVTFTVAQPGTYLLRLETIGAATGLEGHEDFATLDLVVR